MTHIGQCAALYTYGMHLGYLVGNGTEGRNWPERNPFEVHVKPCNDDADATVCQFIAHINEIVIKELSLVNAYNVNVGCQQQYRARSVYRR